MSNISFADLVPVLFNVLILLFLSAVFSGAETAFTNLSRARMEVIKRDNKFASDLIYQLYKKLDLLITLTLALSNGVNILLATYLTIFFSSLFGVELGGTLSATIGTLLVIIFGEIIPKKIAILFPVGFSRSTAHLLSFLNYILYPLLYPLKILNLVMDKAAKRFVKRNEAEARELMQQEIKATLGIGHSHGALESKEYQMMQKLLLLNDKEVKEIMIHRNDIYAVSADKTLREVIEISSQLNISRLPIFTESVDTIEYIIHVPQLSQFFLDARNFDRKIIEFCSTKAFKVPETKILDDLFVEFQKKRVHMAIVLDEFGKTSGLITLEDIVEQIFGEIEDETDEIEVSVERIDEAKVRADGDASLEEVQDILNIQFPNQFPKHKTISWLILDILHRFPEEGEIISVPGSAIKIEVVDKDGEYVDKVFITVNQVK
jgi:putative hemolysin